MLEFCGKVKAAHRTCTEHLPELVVAAGRYINLVAAQINNAGGGGNTLLNAGRDLNLGTVTTASSNSIIWDPTRYRKDSSSTEVGTVVQGAGAITFNAGKDINLRAANIDAGGALTAIACSAGQQWTSA